MNSKTAHLSFKEMLAAHSAGQLRSARLLVEIVLASWFVLVLALGAKGAFIGPPESPPLPILLGATIPLVMFLAAYFGWGTFRTFVLSSGFLSGTSANVTTAPMARLPLVLIPAYLVPLFVMLHLVALFQARAAARMTPTQ